MAGALTALARMSTWVAALVDNKGVYCDLFNTYRGMDLYSSSFRPGVSGCVEATE